MKEASWRQGWGTKMKGGQVNHYHPPFYLRLWSEGQSLSLSGWDGTHDQAPPRFNQAEIANSVIIPAARWPIWWQCSIQGATWPASKEMVTMPMEGT